MAEPNAALNGVGDDNTLPPDVEELLVDGTDPKGGDPRQSRYQSQPTSIDPLDEMGNSIVTGGSKEKEAMGFDCHLETTCRGMNPSFTKKEHRELIRDKWMHWDDLRDARGQVVEHGCLWYPTYTEQALIMSRIFPASALVYAFHGEHNEWLTQDIRDKAVSAKRASVPADPPSVPTGGSDPLALGNDWLDQTTSPFETTGVPSDNASLDQSLPTPELDLPTNATGGIDLDAALDLAEAQVQAHVNVPMEPGVPVPPNMGFDQPPAGSTAERTRKSVAELAAAKSNLNK